MTPWVSDRIKTFNRLSALWDDALGRLDAIDPSCEIRCPHSMCNAGDSRVDTVEYLLNYA